MRYRGIEPLFAELETAVLPLHQYLVKQHLVLIQGPQGHEPCALPLRHAVIIEDWDLLFKEEGVGWGSGVYWGRMGMHVGGVSCPA